MNGYHVRLIIANVWAAAGMVAHTTPGILVCLGLGAIWLALALRIKGDGS